MQLNTELDACWHWWTQSLQKLYLVSVCIYIYIYIGHFCCNIHQLNHYKHS